MTAASGLWLIPPHRDPTLRVEPGPGWTVLDLGASLVSRLLAPAALAATAEAWRAALGAGGSPRALLELEAAREVLQRPAAELSARLRAQGAALQVLTAGGPLRLRLDDLELTTGSTQRGADLVQLAQSPRLPFGPELEQALEAVASAPRVRVLVDCDQRLPFAFALCHRLARQQGRPPLTLCGPFAQRHQEALRACLPGVEFDSLLPTLTLEGAPWRWDGQGAVEEGPWRGYLTLEALAAGTGPAPLLAVVPFAALEEERVLSLQGSWFPRRLLAEAGARFPLVGEWHFGAPVPAALVEQTAARLLASFAWPADGGGVVPAGQPVTRKGFEWLGGLRRFHWSVERPPQAEFAGQPLTLAPVDPALDLARSRGFQVPGMLEEAPLLALVEKVLVALSRGPRPPSPGRVAGGLCRIPARTAAGAGWLRLAPDAALVELPVAMDGRPQRTGVATSLRTGAMLALDPRLLPFLRRLQQPGPAGDFLPGVAPAMREKLMSTLLDRRILEALPEGGAA